MKKKNWEPYVAGGVIMLVWQIVFLKILGLDWIRTLSIGAVSGIMFFIVAVLVMESVKFKGNV